MQAFVTEIMTFKITDHKQNLNALVLLVNVSFNCYHPCSVVQSRYCFQHCLLVSDFVRLFVNITPEPLEIS